MKFVFAVVMLALAAGVQSSLLAAHAPGVSYVTTAAHGLGPWGAHGLGAWGAHGLGAWGAHGLGAPWGGAWAGPLAHGHAAIDLGVHGAPLGLLGGHGAWGGYPGIALSQGPDHAGAHGHGVYVAKTRGAIHTAPLAGHISSATSVNVAPAPGTH